MSCELGVIEMVDVASSLPDLGYTILYTGREIEVHMLFWLRFVEKRVSVVICDGEWCEPANMLGELEAQYGVFLPPTKQNSNLLKQADVAFDFAGCAAYERESRAEYLFFDSTLGSSISAENRYEISLPELVPATGIRSFVTEMSPPECCDNVLPVDVAVREVFQIVQKALLGVMPVELPVSVGAKPVGSDDLELMRLPRRFVSRKLNRVTFEADDGETLCAYDTGSTDGPTIVCVNAFGMSSTLFEPLVEKLGERYRVVTWQSRSVPVVSEMKDEMVSVERQVEDLNCLIRSMQLYSCHLLGWCIGAQVALEYASKLPSSLESLVLLNGVFAYSDVPQSKFQFDLLKSTEYIVSGRDCAKKICQTINLAASHRKMDDGKNKYGEVNASNDAWLGRETMRVFRNPESLYRYALFLNRSQKRDDKVQWGNLPSVLFVVGMDDSVALPAAAKLVSAKCERSKVVEVAGCDHYGHIHAPDQFAQVIDRFCAQ